MLTNNLLYSFNKIRLLNILFYPLSLIYLLLTIIRREYYCSLFKKYKLKVPVFIVGNIVVGGTGKTPFSIWLANFLSLNNFKVAIISGGYKSKNPNLLIDLSKDDVENNIGYLGDETKLIYKKARKDIIVAQCKDRRKLYNYLVDNHKLDIVVCDDGLQHYNLPRDVEIILESEEMPFGNGLLLPSGPLRENLKRREEATFIFTKKKESTSGYLGFTYCNAKIYRLTDNKEVPVSNFINKRVNAITGIAKPEDFIKSLNDLNINTLNYFYPDHYRFTKRDFIFDNNNSIIITEKDAMRINFINDNIYYLSLSIKVDNEIEKALLKKYQDITETKYYR